MCVCCVCAFFFFECSSSPRVFHSFPTRRSSDLESVLRAASRNTPARVPWSVSLRPAPAVTEDTRSEEHTSELQSRLHLVCRLLLEKKKKKKEQVNTINYNSQHYYRKHVSSTFSY